MNHYFKKLKFFFAIITLVTYSTFTQTAHAQTLGVEAINTSNLSACILSSQAAAAATQISKTFILEGIELATEGLDFGTGIVEGTPAASAAAGLAVISVPVADLGLTGQILTLTGSTASLAGGTTVGNLNRDVAEPFLETLAYNIGQCTINALTDSVVLWIQGGFNGSPNFAINPNQLFNELATTVSGRLSEEILGFNALGISLCNFTPTFTNDLANSVSLSNSNYKKFHAQLKCPFGSGALLNFRASDFYKSGKKSFEQNGGWVAFEATLADRGNAYGNRVIVGDELRTRQGAAKSIEEKKLSQGNGFLDIIDDSTCVYPISQSEFDAIDWSDDPRGKKIYQRMYCNTTTPGKIVEGQLTKSLGVSMDRLGLANNVDKIVVALVQQALKGAVSSILGKDNLPPAKAPQAVLYAAISSTAANMLTSVKSGTVNQFANDPTCTYYDNCAAFTLYTNASTGTLTSIKITETGTANSNTDLSNLSLYYNTNGNFSSGVSQFGVTVPNFTPAETATVNGSLTLSSSKTYYFYVRFDAKSSSTFPSAGQTVGFKIAANTDVVVTGGMGTTGAPQWLQGIITLLSI